MGRLNYSDKLALNNSRSLFGTLVMKAEREVSMDLYKFKVT